MTIQQNNNGEHRHKRLQIHQTNRIYIKKRTGREGHHREDFSGASWQLLLMSEQKTGNMLYYQYEKSDYAFLVHFQRLHDASTKTATFTSCSFRLWVLRCIATVVCNVL
jgi:hypothetical protein